MDSKGEFPIPVPPPGLNIPPSSSTVSVSIIDTTSTVYVPPTMVLEPHIEGHDELICPNFAFLITHKGRDGMQKLLFDLGTRKDLEGYAPIVRGLTDQMRTVIESDITEILGAELKEINATIWR
jgi:hypothetical protein